MSIFGNLFGKKSGAALKQGSIFDKEVVDLRSNNEKQISRDAKLGKSLGSEADLLTTELIQIGKGCPFVSSNKSVEFNTNGQHVRAREIGQRLSELGGKNLMLAVHYRVRLATSGERARELECAWDYIGGWLA
jgi:hypothetical protein